MFLVVLLVVEPTVCSLHYLSIPSCEHWGTLLWRSNKYIVYSMKLRMSHETYDFSKVSSIMENLISWHCLAFSPVEIVHIRIDSQVPIRSHTYVLVYNRSSVHSIVPTRKILSMEDFVPLSFLLPVLFSTLYLPDLKVCLPSAIQPRALLLKAWLELNL